MFEHKIEPLSTSLFNSLNVCPQYIQATFRTATRTMGVLIIDNDRILIVRAQGNEDFMKPRDNVSI